MRANSVDDEQDGCVGDLTLSVVLVAVGGRRPRFRPRSTNFSAPVDLDYGTVQLRHNARAGGERLYRHVICPARGRGLLERPLLERLLNALTARYAKDSRFRAPYPVRYM